METVLLPIAVIIFFLFLSVASKPDPPDCSFLSLYTCSLAAFLSPVSAGSFGLCRSN